MYKPNTDENQSPLGPKMFQWPCMRKTENQPETHWHWTTSSAKNWTSFNIHLSVLLCVWGFRNHQFKGHYLDLYQLDCQKRSPNCKCHLISLMALRSWIKSSFWYITSRRKIPHNLLLTLYFILSTYLSLKFLWMVCRSIFVTPVD